MYIIYGMLISLCFFKMLSSKKITISLISMEFASATMLSYLLVSSLLLTSVIYTLLLLTMFVCEGVIGLSLLSVPLVQGGPSPRKLSSSLF
uniref:NADH dehydrogenase subunit 4L n=1 Tax=Hoplopleura kitti TaxID=1511644 RepID=A0A075EAP9_9NEOP|nr:NADH dehydrogenase subunit 4L [Hoplopleura kitti]